MVLAHLRRFILISTSVLLIATTLSPGIILSTTETTTRQDALYSLKVFELLLGTPGNPSSEFITVYNPSDYLIDASLIDVQYSALSSGTNWSSRVASQQPEGVDVFIQPRGFYTYASDAFASEHPNARYHARLNPGLADGGGHIRIVLPEEGILVNDFEEIDLVGWGTAAGPYGNAATAPGRGQSIQRLFDQRGQIVDTKNNHSDFWVVEQPLMRATFATNSADEQVNDEPDKENDEHAAEPPQDGEEPSEHIGDDDVKDEVFASCSPHIVISEMLPNPQGPRSEFPRQEYAFIELYNSSNEATSLHNCGLQTSASSSTYWFAEDDFIPPESFVAFYEVTTGVQLPVSPSGTVYLLSEGDVEVQVITYPASMPEAASWAWFGADDWQTSYSPTPNSQNALLSERPCPDGQERSSETNRCRAIVSVAESVLESCGPGRERNPETNRCRAINDPLAGLVPCGPGQVRNPETNRCRSASPAASSLVPCGPNQERNPETNRCRNIQSASRDLVPCGPGQERNPETNRCRNVASGNNEVMGVQDIYVESVSDTVDWAMTGGVFLLASAYGAWEWRHEISRLRSRLFFWKKK